MSIAENFETVLARVAAAAERSGRTPDDVQLLVVSKTWPSEVVMEAVDAGQTAFGESRVQEAVEKIPAMPGRLRWHLIGHLQKNKVRKALPLFSVIHSVDTLEIARQINRIADELGLYPDVYLQVNVAAEAGKFGFSPDTLLDEFENILELDRLAIQGLMNIPPLSNDPGEGRRIYRRLRELRDEFEARFSVTLPGLSMGMSHDYADAIEEGSTIVRVGSAIFGKRKRKAPV